MTARKLALGIGLGCALFGPGARSARADEASAPAAMSVTGACPSRDAIWADMRAMVPARDLEKVNTAKIDVSDLGADYHVRIVGDDGERRRTFRDLEHDCEHRARFAAIFIVVTLLPPDVLLEAPPEPPPAPPPAPPLAAPPTVVVVAPPPAPPKPHHFRLEPSALFDAAPAVAGSGTSSAVGGEVRARWGTRRVALVAGVGIEPRATFDFGGVTVDELRAPLDFGVALAQRWQRFMLGGEVGPAAAIVRISGTDTAGPQSGTRLDLGGRLAITARFGGASSSVAPVVGIHALLFPRPYEATATPQGNIGQLPALWVGLNAGVSFAP